MEGGGKRRRDWAYLDILDGPSLQHNPQHTHTPLTGLRMMGVGDIQPHRDWKAGKREGDCERHRSSKGDRVKVVMRTQTPLYVYPLKSQDPGFQARLLHSLLCDPENITTPL